MQNTNLTPECDFDSEAHDPDVHNNVERTHSWHLSRNTSPEDWDRYWVEVAVRCKAAHTPGLTTAEIWQSIQEGGRA